MKFEKVKYTAQYEGIHKTNEWISIDVVLEGDETPEMGLDAAKQKIEGWHSKENGAAPAGEIPTINRAHERLRELIEDAKSTSELRSYFDKVMETTNRGLVDAYYIQYGKLSS